MMEHIAQSIFALDANTATDETEDYKLSYYRLFNGISAIIENAHTYDQTIAALKHLQYLAEEFHIDRGHA
ncbi:MAG: hypothetical protein FWE28_03340 [Oscillospiraceae bacterium]|nr:hypothetical protein [Oscillospiraceae bacterium]